ncbi:MAG: TPM domain-containing protein [Candidatus Abyssobacteria bacterium SURF_5]|uniref:TPM domain-containing protein n=1 Tax=Abyssobacteria bacterium (strain SURF_5) TaxID=2093360 RepID=A0A3A4NFS3_ABYX5|nr:MAG: TPM domain-containing protein [Candidatus Abyssubacteria bacterium SURF_5]
MRRSTNPSKFLTPAESRQVTAAVEQAEKFTSGEIKVTLARHCWISIESKASRLFNKLNLDRTRHRNCVMILLVLTNHEFHIHGDQGIHERVGQEFWDDVRDRMSVCFKEDRFGDGLAEGVRLIGEKLAQFFPPLADDTDEISNHIAHHE